MDYAWNKVIYINPHSLHVIHCKIAVYTLKWLYVRGQEVVSA